VPPLTRPPPPNPSPQGGGEEFAALFVSILRFLMALTEFGNAETLALHVYVLSTRLPL